MATIESHYKLLGMFNVTTGVNIFSQQKKKKDNRTLVNIFFFFKIDKYSLMILQDTTS